MLSPQGLSIISSRAVADAKHVHSLHCYHCLLVQVLSNGRQRPIMLSRLGLLQTCCRTQHSCHSSMRASKQPVPQSDVLPVLSVLRHCSEPTLPCCRPQARYHRLCLRALIQELLLTDLPKMHRCLQVALHTRRKQCS